MICVTATFVAIFFIALIIGMACAMLGTWVNERSQRTSATPPNAKAYLRRMAHRDPEAEITEEDLR